MKSTQEWLLKNFKYQNYFSKSVLDDLEAVIWHYCTAQEEISKHGKDVKIFESGISYKGVSAVLK